MEHEALKNYRAAETLGSTQLNLILQVYDGALGALNRATGAYQAKQLDRGYNELEKARRFVTHLYTTLNLEEGGEVAANLARLYAFVISEIDSVQATKDLEHLEKIADVLRNVRDGWAGLKGQIEENGDKSDRTDSKQHQSFAASV